MRKQHLETHCAYQESMLARQSGSTFHGRGAYFPPLHYGQKPQCRPIQIVTVLKHVASKQPFRSIDDDVAIEIAQDSNGNLRKAILVFEALKMQS